MFKNSLFLEILAILEIFRDLVAIFVEIYQILTKLLSNQIWRNASEYYHFLIGYQCNSHLPEKGQHLCSKNQLILLIYTNIGLELTNFFFLHFPEWTKSELKKQKLGYDLNKLHRLPGPGVIKPFTSVIYEFS